MRPGALQPARYTADEAVMETVAWIEAQNPGARIIQANGNRAFRVPGYRTKRMPDIIWVDRSGGVHLAEVKAGNPGSGKTSRQASKDLGIFQEQIARLAVRGDALVGEDLSNLGKVVGLEYHFYPGESGKVADSVTLAVAASSGDTYLHVGMEHPRQPRRIPVTAPNLARATERILDAIKNMPSVDINNGKLGIPASWMVGLGAAAVVAGSSISRRSVA